MSGFYNTVFGQVKIIKRAVHLRMADEVGEDGCKTIRYDVTMPDGKMTLHKLMNTDEWFPNGLNGHFPAGTVNAMKEIIEKEKL